MNRWTTLFLALVFCLIECDVLLAEEGPKVALFTPQGIVKSVRQVRARFSEPMVPFGDPRVSVEPFDIQCPVKGKARWADSNNWVYDFGRDLPAGIRCEFRLRPGLKALSGREVVGQRNFTFSTGGPAIRSCSPYDGNKWISEDQIFVLTLDAEPTPESVKAHVGFAIRGIEGLVGARVVEGAEREEILKSLSPYERRRGRHRSILLIQCRQRFPSRAPVRLVWGKGILSKSGVPTDKDQVLSFTVRGPFTAEFRCERENPRAGCVPFSPMTISFSAPLSSEQARAIVLKGEDGRTWNAEPEGQGDYPQRIQFRGPFPEKSRFTVELPKGLKDDAGRPLLNADKFPLSVHTAGYSPLAKFQARFGILEFKGDRLLPVTLRNLEPSVKARMKKVQGNKRSGEKVKGRLLNVSPSEVDQLQPALKKTAAARRGHSMLAKEKGVREFQIPKPGGAKAFEVVGIPLEKPGLYLVELESPILGAALLGRPATMYVPTAVLVTNLSVHFKQGRESSLVWVTTLDKGEPVRNAAVSVRDCREKVLWEGRTDDDGIARINESLPDEPYLQACSYRTEGWDWSQMGALRDLNGGLFITAQIEGDMSFVHSSWNEGIELWRFKLRSEKPTAPVLAHTVFDRSLFRAGQTVHMKHVLRQHVTTGFSQVPQEKRPSKAHIVHFGSDQVFELPLNWDGQGIAENTWTIPKDAKLGTYGVVISGIKREAGGGEDQEASNAWRGGWNTLTTGTFRVEEFRVPLLKGVIQPPEKPLVNATEVNLDLGVHYLSGGGAGEMPVRLRAQVGPRRLPVFPGFEGFVFGNGGVKEGLEERGQGYGEYEEESWDEEGETSEVRRSPAQKDLIQLPTQDLVLDGSGAARAIIPQIPRVESPKELLAEMEYRDPNGEIQTVSSRIPLWNSGILVGLRPDAWAVSKDGLKFQVAVLDISGKPVSGAKVRVELFEKKYLTHRKRLVGGFYAYQHTTEIRRLDTLFEGSTDAKGLLLGKVRSPISGQVILVASTTDGSGNPSAAHQGVWVADKDRWWFMVEDHDRIDLLPERKRYEPGDRARFQVRMPFKEATALISVEREGILDTWVQNLKGEEPVIEVPVKGSYAPNVFVSALVVRGRVGEIQPTALVDLGKPAYKLGIGEIHVGWKEHELKVSVTPDQKTYKIRQKASVHVRVCTLDGKAPPPGSEVALAAVDEGLLELMANRSWDILPAMMGLRGYGVATSTAQMHVVGKRHFGIKALPTGGGGGRQVTRELFETLLLWKGRVPLDPDGKARVEVPLNDSITSFRIVAVATAGDSLFGSGFTSIQSTQDLMIFSGLPPLVRGGDRYLAEFTVRNTSQRVMKLEVTLKSNALKEDGKPLSLDLKPGEARKLGQEVTVPEGLESLLWEVEAREKNTQEGDRLRVSQKVVPAVPVRTFQATLSQVAESMSLPVEIPSDALPGRGQIRVNYRPRIAEGLTGVSDYMNTYPYTCMEQRVSMAVALRDEGRWKQCMAEVPTHLDGDGLLKYFPICLHGSPVLTAYVLAIGHEAGWGVPEDYRQKMSAGLKKFVEGKLMTHSPLAAADLSIQKLAALEALSRYEELAPALVDSITVEPNLWPTSTLLDWLNLLLNMEEIPMREERLRDAEQILRSRLNFQGTVMGFSTERSDCLWWLMVSGDVNAVRSILTLLRLNGDTEDVGRVVEGAVARQKKGHWDLTLANAWGTLALEKFSRFFESQPVEGKTRTDLDDRSRILDWAQTPKGESFDFPWPPTREKISIVHEGSGRPWVTIQGLAAIPLKEPFSSGYRVRKSITPVERKDASRWTRGDVLRVRLEMEAQADQTWVVVSDPVPAGSTILGSGLGRDSALLSGGEKAGGGPWLTHRERSFEAFRAYYEYVPKGKWQVEYTLRLNQSGRFQLPPTRVEALYFPEMFGELPNLEIEVAP